MVLSQMFDNPKCENFINSSELLKKSDKKNIILII